MIARKLIAFAVVAAGVFLALPEISRAQSCGTQPSKDAMLVSTSWLADHLKDPKLVLLSVGEKSEYDSGHIPGAIWVDYHMTHQMEAPNGLSLELLPLPQAKSVFEKLGISNDSTIVLYRSMDWSSPTTRIFLQLDAMGLGAHEAVLDGGFGLWAAEHRAITKDVPSPKPGKIDPCAADAAAVASIDDVKAAIHHPGITIIDARAPDFWEGKSASNGHKGRIPGAGNIPYTTLYDDAGKLKTREQLASMFQNAGMKPSDKLILYCHIGQQATAVWFAARYMGYDARLYDGSWEDWSNHKDSPIEAADGH